MGLSNGADKTVEEIVDSALQRHLGPVVEELGSVRNSIEKGFDGFFEVVNNLLEKKAPENYIPQSTHDKVMERDEKIMKWILGISGVLILGALGIQGANQWLAEKNATQRKISIEGMKGE